MDQRSQHVNSLIEIYLWIMILIYNCINANRFPYPCERGHRKRPIGKMPIKRFVRKFWCLKRDDHTEFNDWLEEMVGQRERPIPPSIKCYWKGGSSRYDLC